MCFDALNSSGIDDNGFPESGRSFQCDPMTCRSVAKGTGEKGVCAAFLGCKS